MRGIIMAIAMIAATLGSPSRRCQAEGPPAPPQKASAPVSTRHAGAWVAAGASAALAVASTVLALSADAREDDLAMLLEIRDSNGAGLEFTGAARARYESKLDEGQHYETMAWITAGAAAAAAATTIVLFIFDEGTPAAPEVTLTTTRDRQAITGAWSF